MTYTFSPTPWSKKLKFSSVVGSIIVFVLEIIIICLMSHDYTFTYFVSLLVCIEIVIYYIYSITSIITGYTISKRTLTINYIIGKKRYNIKKLKNIYLYNYDLNKPSRIVGNFGLFRFFGIYIDKKIGKIKMYLNSFNKIIILELNNQSIAISPNSSQRFLGQISLLFPDVNCKEM